MKLSYENYEKKDNIQSTFHTYFQGQKARKKCLDPTRPKTY